MANLPVIFLLNPDQPASDYISEKNNLSTMLTKPFTPDQLMTAIRSLLKRSNLVLQDKILRYKELSMDLTTYQVLKKDKSIRLGPTEFKILQLFMQSPKIIFSRQNIIDKVWGINKNIALRTVDVHINRIRLSLKGNGPDEFIKTTRSAGYHLDVSNDTEDHHPIN